MRLLLLGASGTIGQATAAELLRRGHEVVALSRANTRPEVLAGAQAREGRAAVAGFCTRTVDFSDVRSLIERGVAGQRFDAVVSCMASRSGAPRDAWAVDHQAHLNMLQAMRATGIDQMVLLSAICVQRPMLAFQQAKLAFETALIDSGLRYSIVRPTAFFKSLSGQVERVRRGQPFLLFGNGELTACKPISDRDLAAFLADCLTDPQRQQRILPIGGPGPAQTPLQQAQALFEAAGLVPRYRRVPVALMDAIIAVLSLMGRVWPSAADKAEFARIGRYYATESMLVWNEADERYDDDATPSYGQDRLIDYQRDLLAGRQTLQRGEHAVF